MGLSKVYNSGFYRLVRRKLTWINVEKDNAYYKNILLNDMKLFIGYM